MKCYLCKVNDARYGQYSVLLCLKHLWERRELGCAVLRLQESDEGCDDCLLSDEAGFFPREDGASRSSSSTRYSGHLSFSTRDDEVWR